MSGDFGPDIGATERVVREWQERATEKAGKFGRRQQRIEQIEVTETSRDGAIQVTVSADMLRNLQLSDAASNRPLAKLGTDFMRTIQSAQAKVPDRMREAVADTVGLQDAAAQHVLDQARKTFPEPPGDAPVPPNSPGHEVHLGAYRPPHKRNGPEDDWDEDFGNGSFLR